MEHSELSTREFLVRNLHTFLVIHLSTLCVFSVIFRCVSKDYYAYSEGNSWKQKFVFNSIFLPHLLLKNPVHTPSILCEILI